jgi:hypothetical protein
VKRKYIKSGDIIEIYEYEKEIVRVKNETGRRGVSEGREKSEEEVKRNRSDSLAKAKKTLRRLINANVHKWTEQPKFLTLTFKENVQDVKLANSHFKNFIKRFGYKLDLKIKYSAVIEFQKRGAIHYHVVLYNVPYFDVNELSEIWGHGFTKLNKIDQVDNIGAYVTKYMTKDNDDPRLVGQKCYFNSRGLHKPEEHNELNKKKIDSLKESLSQFQVYNNTFENEHTGEITYTQYNLSRKQD